MKNLIAITIATAVAACGGSGATGVGRAPVSVDFYGAMPFNQVTNATIKVFSDAAGTTQVGADIAVPACTLPYDATTANCFDGGNLSTFAGGTTTLGAAAAKGATSVTVAATTGLQLNGNVTIGVGPIAETVMVTAIGTGTFTAYPALKNAHASGEMVVNAIRPPKFFGYSLELAGSADPGTNYWISILYFNGAAQVGLADKIKVSVISGKVNTLAVSAANTYTSANGVVITASTGFVSYLGLGAPKAMSVTAIDPSGGTLSYAWTATACTGFAFDVTNAASVNFTAPAAATSACKVTATVTSSNAIPTAAKSTTIAVANDVVINEGAAPPQINQIVISSGNTADTTCTLKRAAPGCAGNACWPNVSCQVGFARPTTPLNAANAYASQAYFLNVAISASLGGEGFNPNAPPAATATVDCPNDLIDFPRDTKGKPKVSVSFAAGSAANDTTTTGNVNEWATDSYFQEPSFTFAKGAYDGSKTYLVGDVVIASGFVWTALANANLAYPGEDATAWSKGESATAISVANQAKWTANGTPGLCTVSVKVTNQGGGADIVPVGVYFQ